MTVTLLSHYLPTERENYQRLADILLPNRDKYCARHGYVHHVHSGPYRDATLYYAVQRLHLLLDLMKSPNATDAYWVLNIQSIITNPTIKVESFLTEGRDFFAHSDINAKINAGSFLIRNTEWARLWVAFLIEDVKTHDHCWHENWSMIRHCHNPPWVGKIHVADHPGINSYSYREYGRGPETPGDWRPDHLVLSLPGLSLDQRIAIAQRPDMQAIINA